MKICSIPNCGKKTIARGWCSTHYSRWFQNGTQVPKRDFSLTVEQRFAEKISRSAGCWLWTGASSKNGYGHLRIGEKSFKAHRVSWELSHGRIPEGMWVLHKCDVKQCVRPDHLFLGTRLDNVRDMISKGLDAYGEKSGVAKLTQKQVNEIRSIGHSRPFTETARIYGVTGAHIGLIVRGKSWKRNSVG